MLKYCLLALSACAPIELPGYVSLRAEAEREGTAIRLPDGRLVSVRIRPMMAGGLGVTCGDWVPPDTIWLTDDPTHCPSLELLLTHEIGHATGRMHTLTGVMAMIPQEDTGVLVVQR